MKHLTKVNRKVTTSRLHLNFYTLPLRKVLCTMCCTTTATIASPFNLCSARSCIVGKELESNRSYQQQLKSKCLCSFRDRHSPNNCIQIDLPIYSLKNTNMMYKLELLVIVCNCTHFVCKHMNMDCILYSLI